MFVEYVTRVDQSLPEVEKCLDRLRSHQEDWDGVAFQKEGEWRARVRPSPGVSREVGLEMWPSDVYSSGVVHPMRWSVLGSTSLFPSLNADLVLSKEGADHTKMTLRGTYEPPLGALGRVVDRTLLGRFAEAAVADWMERLADRLNSKN